MDRRKRRSYLVRAAVALALGAGFVLGGAVLTPAHADDVIWLKPHKASSVPAAPAPSTNDSTPTLSTFDVIWL
jgi:hypothetical protein